jgi:hypothetical protein
MEIKYLGGETVFLKGKKESVLVNPESGLDSRDGSRIVLYSDENDGRADLNGDKVFINSVGEYEVGGVEILGISGGGEDTVYKLIIDGFKTVIIDGLKEELSEKRIEKVEEADVLVVGLEAESLLNYKISKELAKKWGANYLIPISTNSEVLNKFLDEADNEGLEAVDSLKVEKMEDLPDGLEIKLLKVAK